MKTKSRLDLRSSPMIESRWIKQTNKLNESQKDDDEIRWLKKRTKLKQKSKDVIYMNILRLAGTPGLPPSCVITDWFGCLLLLLLLLLLKSGQPSSPGFVHWLVWFVIFFTCVNEDFFFKSVITARCIARARLRRHLSDWAHVPIVSNVNIGESVWFLNFNH